MSRRAFGYGASLVAAAAIGAATVLGAEHLSKDAYFLLVFLAVLGTSVVGGLGPGLAATLMASAIGHFAPADLISSADVGVLIVEGILVSVVGGTLRSARINASQRLAENLRLEQQILEISDDERRRIGHDLHDGLGQHLTGISLLAETISQQIEATGKPDAANVETITELSSQAIRISRDLAKSLSPVTLEQDGLIAALEELAQTSSGLFGIGCVCNVDGDELAMDRARSLHLYRIVQEAVSNSVRHGKAHAVRIDLARSGKNVCVTINDDGIGLSEKTSHNPGLGLRIMQYRARMLGASLTIERAGAAGGTVVTCICPM
jgi:signal transduction histidine kinase